MKVCPTNGYSIYRFHSVDRPRSRLPRRTQRTPPPTTITTVALRSSEMSSTCLRSSSASACILRDIHADVVDVDDVSYSPAYIVLIRPNVGPFAHSLGTLPSHTVAKTYSEWRRLYQTLLRVSDGQHRAACTCVQGSCPFWTMHPIVQCIPFPKKDFFRRRHSPVLLQTRKRALSYFVTTVLSKLQIFRPDLFDSSRTYSTASSARPPSRNCTFLRALETFLGLDDDTIGRQFANVTHKSRLKLTLQGWHLDRRSLCSVTTTTA